MTRGVPHAGSARTLGPTLAIAGMMLALAGCSGALSWAGAGKLVGAINSGSLEADVLRIATSWPRSEQVRLELEFFEWIAGNPSVSVPGRIELAWTTVDAGEQLDRLCDRYQP